VLKILHDLGGGAKISHDFRKVHIDPSINYHQIDELIKKCYTWCIFYCWYKNPIWPFTSYKKLRSNM